VGGLVPARDALALGARLPGRRAPPGARRCCSGAGDKKGDRRAPRADPADLCGGTSPHPGDCRARRRAGVSTGMVAVAQGPSGGCQALPQRQARPSSGETGLWYRATRAPNNSDAILALSSARLTEAQWARIEPLLPQNGGRGRRWRDLRRLIDGMLWVHASGASWRDLPEEEFGPWQTVYSHYNRWRKEGLWQRIAELLWCQR
jgi:Putative transposase of IS4/5 family (DUF4096)